MSESKQGDGKMCADVRGLSVKRHYILGMRVDVTSYGAASQQILNWALMNESRFVCVANVHMVMEAYDDAVFRKIVDSGDLVTPDGMPLVWALRWLATNNVRRVYGPDLMLYVCAAAAAAEVPVGFYGGDPKTLEQLEVRLRAQFPNLNVVYSCSPPFRPLTTAEDKDVVKKMNESGVRILFVGLGCPKQEVWMAEHRGRVDAVMLGVGAAFDFHAGKVKQAPSWMQCVGLEWLFRLIMEPRRLWKRYLKHNPRFVGLIAMQLLRLRSY